MGNTWSKNVLWLKSFLRMKTTVANFQDAKIAISQHLNLISSYLRFLIYNSFIYESKMNLFHLTASGFFSLFLKKKIVEDCMKRLPWNSGFIYELSELFHSINYYYSVFWYWAFIFKKKLISLDALSSGIAPIGRTFLWQNVTVSHIYIY